MLNILFQMVLFISNYSIITDKLIMLIIIFLMELFVLNYYINIIILIMFNQIIKMVFI